MCSADEEVQGEQPPTEALNGVSETHNSDALAAFLDSAPDPFKARPPATSQVRSSHVSPPLSIPTDGAQAAARLSARLGCNEPCVCSAPPCSAECVSLHGIFLQTW